MKDEELTRALRGRGPEAPMNADHRDGLEEELLRRFDGRTARRLSPRRRSPTWRQLSFGIGVLAIVTATQVPAEYQVEVGKRLTIVLNGRPPPHALGETFAPLLVGRGGRLVDTVVKARRGPEGASVITVDVWGDRLVDDATALERARAIPELAGADIQVSHFDGRVRDNLVGKLGYTLFRRGASAEEREAARQQVLSELRRAAGEDAEIDVQVEELQGSQRVRVKVLKRGEGTDPEAEPPPLPRER